MREIISYPDVRLIQKSRPVNLEIDMPLVKSLIEDMKFYIGDSSGVAAVQLGEPIRLFSFNFGAEVVFIINPEIIKHSPKTMNSEEGCLSLPVNERRVMKRWKQVTLRGMLIDGTIKTFSTRDISCRIIQHEMDHLNGVLINTKV